MSSQHNTKTPKWIALLLVVMFILAFRPSQERIYSDFYLERVNRLEEKLSQFEAILKKSDLKKSEMRQKLIDEIHRLPREYLKSIDFWLRYYDPINYRLINGPLPVEWETEVFEKFEKPYKRLGGGLSLAEEYLHSDNVNQDSLIKLISTARVALQLYKRDSIIQEVIKPESFFFANRLFLLNLSAIYITGFECPDTAFVIKELGYVINGTYEIYRNFEKSEPQYRLSKKYLDLYIKLIESTGAEPNNFSHFNRFRFIKEFVNPLFAMNQEMIRQYKLKSRSYVDFSLNNEAKSIFAKNLYTGMKPKGIFSMLEDPKHLEELREMGKLLFFDPILSSNNNRSCASCHKPDQFFTDTILKTSLHLDGVQSLPRNSPTITNVIHNQLIMLDGKLHTLQAQGKAVITNPAEMGDSEKDVLRKINSCKQYKQTFRKLLKYTPEEPKVSLSHIVSALSIYYSKFSYFTSDFDEAINTDKSISADIINGFNLFMSKAQCGTCHFPPTFGGLKPPYTSTEFEVIGTPEHKAIRASLSKDKGRGALFPEKETQNAFRTPILRNIQHTKPYMHNGVFTTLNEVINFYNDGGGVGRGVTLSNQTLSPDSLKLTEVEKKQLVVFLNSLTEHIPTETPPVALPVSTKKLLNSRKVGGIY